MRIISANTGSQQVSENCALACMLSTQHGCQRSACGGVKASAQHSLIAFAPICTARPRPGHWMNGALVCTQWPATALMMCTPLHRPSRPGHTEAAIWWLPSPPHPCKVGNRGQPKHALAAELAREAQRFAPELEHCNNAFRPVHLLHTLRLPPQCAPIHPLATSQPCG